MKARFKREDYTPSDYKKVAVNPELKFEVYINEDRFCAMFFSGRRNKPDAHIRYKTLEQMNKSINEKISYLEQKIKDDAIAKAEIEKQALKLAENIKVGDIFCYSWGWEQTNVDFYQVIEKKTAKTMTVSPINFETLEVASWASDYVRPVRDSFKSDRNGNIIEEKVRINKWGGFNRSCGTASKVEDPKTSRHYRSWYA